MDLFSSLSLLNLYVSLYFTLALTCRALGSGTQDDGSLGARGRGFERLQTLHKEQRMLETT